MWMDIDTDNLVGSGDRFLDFFKRLVPPDWDVTSTVIESTAETLMIALAHITRLRDFFAPRIPRCHQCFSALDFASN